MIDLQDLRRGYVENGSSGVARVMCLPGHRWLFIDLGAVDGGVSDNDGDERANRFVRPQAHRPGGVPGKVVEATAKGLMVPGAMVFLRTPQVNYEAAVRHDRTRHADAADGGHAFPDRVEHQDDDGGTDRAARSGQQAAIQRSRFELRPGASRRREHHDRRAVEDA